ncbi:MAG: protease pro-enzyme activation domain-containing protein [Candidatus Acidiferrales bacterium]
MRPTKPGKTLIPLLVGSLLSFSTGGASAQTQPVRARITEAVDETNLVQLRGNVHPLARPEFDQGVVADSQPMNRMLLLLQRSPEQEAALRKLMDDQQNKASANFHAWLTPEQFGKKFGAADEDIQAVTAWLTSHGFQVSKVSKGRTVIEFSGTVAQVRNAFHTEIHRLMVKGEEHVANVSDPQIPAALSPVVSGVVALHNFRPKSFLHSAGTFRRNAKTGEVKRAFTFSDVNGTFYAVGPADFATIYNIPAQCGGSACDGHGQSIAIVGQSNINLQDVTDFRSIFGLPAYSSICNSGLPPQCQLSVILNGPDPGLVSGDETESDLDLEWAGAVAPQANIIFVTTQTTQTDLTAGIDGSALYVVDNNVAPVLSESYGNCEAGLGTTGNAFYNSLWQQAAAEGITVVIAAGDNGSAGCDPAPAPADQNAATLGLAVSGIASTPFNVAAGGTDFDDATNQPTYWSANNTSGSQASALGYIPETTWNDSCASTATAGNVSGHCTTVNSNGIDLVAGSGGPSSIYTTKPSWQTGFGDSSRDIPDVSLFSSDGGPTNVPTKSFYIVCESDQDITGDAGCSLTKFTSATPFHDFQAVGGTSAATPTFAAIMALVNQKTGQRQGVANYVLYSLAKIAANVCNSSTATLPNSCVFNDITKGNNSVACVGGSPNCSNTSTAANQFGIMATAKGGTTPAFGAAAGYDMATGLGSVNVTNLLASWASPASIGTMTTLAGPSSATLDTSMTFTGTVAKNSGTATPTGLVVLEDVATGVVIDTTSLTAAGTYSISTTFLPASASPYNVIAHYGGDGTFGPSDSNAINMTVVKQNSQVVVSFVTFTGTTGTTPVLNTSKQSLTYGSPYILRVDVENANGTPCENFQTGAVLFVCPTGAIQLLRNGSPLNDFPNAQNTNATNLAKLNDRGFAEDQPIQLLASSTPYAITATYTADANSSYNSNASSNTLSVTISKATTTAAVKSNVATITSGGSVTLTTTVSTNSNGEAPCGSGVANPGTVQFMNGSSVISGTVAYTGTSGAQSSTGLASCTATLIPTLSFLTPPPTPRHIPNVPFGPMSIVACLLLMMFLLSLGRLPVAKRLGYAGAGLLLFAFVAAEMAGCGGGSSSSGGSGAHSDSITAVYSGDGNYAGSPPSTAVTISVQ